MRKIRSRVALVALLWVALGLVCDRAMADTIVLKNGKRIVALAVVEEGDKVRYQTSAGELTLPKSIVDHIEKGGPVPEGSPGASAANLAITAPVAELPEIAAGGGEIERSAVH